MLILSSAAELATVIIAGTFPTMPRLWAYIWTRDREAQRHTYTSSELRLAPYSTRKARQPIRVEQSSSSGDNVPLKGDYSKLQGREKKSRQDELEMQILKTQTYEVTSQKTNGLPEIP